MIATVVIGFLLLGNSPGGAASLPESIKRPATMVLFTEAREITFSEVVTSDSSIRARFYALVSPRIKGNIDNVFVREGTQVEAEETKLFQIDNEKLRQTVDLDTQALIIAKSTLEERKANLDNAEAELAQVEKDFARTEQLHGQKVVTLTEYEQNQTKVRQRDALRRLAHTQVVLAEQTVRKAESVLKWQKGTWRIRLSLLPLPVSLAGDMLNPEKWVRLKNQ